MLIPAQKPDGVEAPAILRRETQPVQPTLPVSGMPEQAQRADPRLAVQTVQPGFQGEATSGLRPAPGLAQTPQPPALPTGTAGPSAVLQLTPQADSLSQWLGRALAQRAPGQILPWPAADPATQAQAEHIAQTLGQTAGPMRTLWALYLALARSDRFATSHLFRQFWPEQKPKPGDHGADIDQLRRWVEALAPEAEPALQAARMLMGEPLQWQGELMPGWPLVLRREDAWRPGSSGGPLEKAAALRLELTVPGQGPLHIHALAWNAREIDIRLSWPPQVTWPESAWSRLQSRLAQMGLPGLKLSRQAWSEEDSTRKGSEP